MPQPARAHDSWADAPEPPLPRRRRREAVHWASAEELEVLGGLGQERVADWTVLTLEREGPAALEPRGSEALVAAAPSRRFARAAEPAGRAVSTPEPVGSARAGAAGPRSSRASARAAEPAAPEPAGAVDRATGSAGSRHVPEATVPEPASRWRAAEPGGRRTVVIRGQATPPRATSATRRRPSRRPRDRVAHRPDRVAMWAVGLGLLLILVAAITAGGSPA